MVPADFSIFFSTMAVVGATLFGLIFVAISIAPEKVISSTAQVDRQVRATAAYVALLNPLMVSLFALVPNQWIGIPATVLSWVGILNTLAMSVTLFQSVERGSIWTRNLIFIFISLILYSFEAYVASKLNRTVIDVVWLNILADLFIFITLFGIVRAWELIGIRQFRLRDWLEKIVNETRKVSSERSRDADLDEVKEKEQREKD